MVEENSRLAIAVALVAESVLNLGLVARRRAREDVRAHRHGDWAIEIDLVVGEDHLFPSQAIAVEIRATSRNPKTVGSHLFTGYRNSC